MTTGSFSKSTSEIERTRDQAVESIRQEGSARSEEIRQLTAKIVEETKSEGSIKIEKFKLQRDLILDAINTKDRLDAQKRLKFFASTGLIPDYASKVLAFTTNESINEIPVLLSDSEKKLSPLLNRYPEKIISVVKIQPKDQVIGGNSFCNGFVITSSSLITPTHCLSSDSDVLNTFISYRDKAGDPHESDVNSVNDLTATNENSYANGANNISVVATVSNNLVSTSNFKIRKPVVGENVIIVGLAMGGDVGYRGFVVTSLEKRKFIADACSVTEVIEDSGYMTTDCRTTQGTSGSPIFAENDGALLSLVAWGRHEDETNGPLLYQFPSVMGLAGTD